MSKKVFENDDFIVTDFGKDSSFEGLAVIDKHHGIEIHIQGTRDGVTVSSQDNFTVKATTKNTP
jgi:hypothetical protein